MLCAVPLLGSRAGSPHHTRHRRLLFEIFIILMSDGAFVYLGASIVFYLKVSINMMVIGIRMCHIQLGIRTHFFCGFRVNVFRVIHCLYNRSLECCGNGDISLAGAGVEWEIGNGRSIFVGDCHLGGFVERQKVNIICGRMIHTEQFVTVQWYCILALEVGIGDNITCHTGRTCHLHTTG